MTATWKTQRNFVHEATKGLEKSRADSAAQSLESYKKDLEKSHDDRAAWSRKSYWKDPEKSRAWNC